jgi:NAD(P)H-nitrite reductase large subunit
VYIDEKVLEKQLGKEIGTAIDNEHKANGVVLHPRRRLVEIKGSNGATSSVKLDDGTEIQADLVIIGVGVLPATKFLSGSGV